VKIPVALAAGNVIIVVLYALATRGARRIATGVDERLGLLVIVAKAANTNSKCIAVAWSDVVDHPKGCASLRERSRTDPHGLWMTR
jgi:hypothetical protein